MPKCDKIRATKVAKATPCVALLQLNMEADFIQKSKYSLLSPIELAKFFGISKASIYRLIETRVLPFYKIGGSIRFRHEDIEGYMDKCRVKSVRDNI